MTKVKFCGIKRAEDVTKAVALGVDFLGFIHVPNSPRHLDIDALRELLPLVPKPIETVVVVQDAPPETLETLRRELTFDHFQFHGEEDEMTLKTWGGYKACHVHGASAQAPAFASASFYLLDTQTDGQRGGTGKTFNWLVLKDMPGRFLVAGGLDPENVGELIRSHKPWGVDVSGGIEAAPGIKDHAKMQKFINNVRSLV